MAQAYYRKWRPSTWEEIVGQEAIVHTLHNAVTLNKTAHAYLFSGPRGTGKTSTARILAKALNCTQADRSARPCEQCENCQAIQAGRFLDLIEIDAASNTSVDDIRDLREKVNYSPSQGDFKVYIIDEVHMLSTAAFNALLKTLEEPPAHTVFILATTEIQKIPATVLSRCQRYEFRQIPLNHITVQLKSIAEKENLEFEMEALTMIARQATGSLRDAISLMDQIASTGDTISLALTEEVLGTSSDEKVLQLVDVLLKRKTDEAIGVIHAALDSGTDARQFSNQVVDYLRALMLIKVGNSQDVEVTQDMKNRMQSQCESISVPCLVDWMRQFSQAQHHMGSRWQPSLALELAVVECLEDADEETQEPASAIPPISKPENKKIILSSKPASTPKPQELSKEEQPIKIEKSEEPEATKLVEKKEAIKTAVEESTDKKTSQSMEETILERWKDIRSMVRQEKPHTAALLNSCKSIHLQGNRLKLGFESELLKSKMDTDVNREVTRNVIKDVLGLEVNVDCLVVKNSNNNHNNYASEEHGDLVKTALSLGGEIIEKE